MTDKVQYTLPNDIRDTNVSFWSRARRMLHCQYQYDINHAIFDGIGPPKSVNASDTPQNTEMEGDTILDDSNTNSQHSSVSSSIGEKSQIEKNSVELENILSCVLDHQENQSALLLGARGTGKSMVLRKVLQRLYTRYDKYSSTSLEDCTIRDFLTPNSMLNPDLEILHTAIEKQCTDRQSDLALKSKNMDSTTTNTSHSGSSDTQKKDDISTSFTSLVLRSPPFLVVYLNGLLIEDDAAAVKQIAYQLSSDPNLDFMADEMIAQAQERLQKIELGTSNEVVSASNKESLEGTELSNEIGSEHFSNSLSDSVAHDKLSTDSLTGTETKTSMTGSGANASMTDRSESNATMTSRFETDSSMTGRSETSTSMIGRSETDASMETMTKLSTKESIHASMSQHESDLIQSHTVNISNIIDDTTNVNGSRTASAGTNNLRKRTRASMTKTKDARMAASSANSRNNYDQHLMYFVDALREGRASKVPVFLVIDEFDVFARKTKQTLLYNLLDLTQSNSVQIGVIGISSRIDCVQLLEKRLKSRFSHRQLLFSHPSFVEYTCCVRQLLQLPSPYKCNWLQTDIPSVIAFNQSAELVWEDSNFVRMIEHFWRIGRSIGWIKRWLLHSTTLLGISKREIELLLEESLGELGHKFLPEDPEYEEESVLETNLWTSELLIKSAQEFSRDARVQMLLDLSQMEYILLCCFARLERNQTPKITFSAAYDEYLEYCNSEHSDTKPLERSIMLRCFEALLIADLLKYEVFAHHSFSPAPVSEMPTKLFSGVPESDLSAGTHRTSGSFRTGTNDTSREESIHETREYQAVILQIDPDDIMEVLQSGEISLGTTVRYWLLGGKS